MNCVSKRWELGKILKVHDNGTRYTVKRRDNVTFECNISGFRTPRLWLRFYELFKANNEFRKFEGKVEMMFRTLYAHTKTDSLLSEVGYAAVVNLKKE
eukprot:UN30106